MGVKLIILPSSFAGNIILFLAAHTTSIEEINFFLGVLAG
jgi:hypothetical protein